MAMIEFDLTPYAEVPKSNFWNGLGNVWLRDRESGLKAAKDFGLLKLASRLQNGDLFTVKVPF